MCRLAALSDADHAVVLAEWVATSYIAGYKAVSTDAPHGQLQLDPIDDAFGATG
jgi:hypothetical protein